MKKNFMLILIFFIALNFSFAYKALELPDLKKPHQIVVDGNDLYIFDEDDYSLHFYTISPLALKLKMGAKGDKSNEFKYLPFLFVQPESLACTDFTKTIWFSKNGKILNIKQYSDFKNFNLNSEMLLIPAQKNFLRIIADHERQERYVYLLDSEFKFIKELYKGPFFWRSDAPVHYRTDTVCYKNLIFVSDTQKGFFIKVFNETGIHLHTIDRSRDIEKIPNRPLLHQYCVSNEKIYTTTYDTKGNNTEMIILDLNGFILKRLYLPLKSIRPNRGVLRYDLFVVDQDKLYEIVKNGETGKWMLLITDLEQ